jgi:small subunit ribosomal protein S8e
LEPLEGEQVVVVRRTRGGTPKWGLRSAAFANVLDPATRKLQRAKILRVLANPANRDYERRRVITKGAVIETEFGRARVLSRPAQDAVVNAVLLK